MHILVTDQSHRMCYRYLGREQPGKCFRLYTSLVYDSLDAVTLPEIQRVDIAQVILQLKSLRIVNPLEFDYLSPPSVSALRKGLELLTCLGALNRDGSLSAHGILMSRLPLDPTYSHLLLKSVDFGCTSEILTGNYLQYSTCIFTNILIHTDVYSSSFMLTTLLLHSKLFLFYLQIVSTCSPIGLMKRHMHTMLTDDFHRKMVISLRW